MTTGHLTRFAPEKDLWWPFCSFWPWLSWRCFCCWIIIVLWSGTCVNRRSLIPQYLARHQSWNSRTEMLRLTVCVLVFSASIWDAFMLLCFWWTEITLNMFSVYVWFTKKIIYTVKLLGSWDFSFVFIYWFIYCRFAITWSWQLCLFKFSVLVLFNVVNLYLVVLVKYSLTLFIKQFLLKLWESLNLFSEMFSISSAGLYKHKQILAFTDHIVL